MGCDHYPGDHAVAVSHNVVAVDLTPFVALARSGKVMGLPVVDTFATVPVVIVHVVAALPFLVANVLLVLGVPAVVMIVLLGESHQWRGEDAEQDE